MNFFVCVLTFNYWVFGCNKEQILKKILEIRLVTMGSKMASKIKFRTFFLFTAVLIIISLIVLLVPSIVLGSINGRIKRLQLQGSLTQTEQQTLTDLTWSQVWWETQQATIFNPFALVFLVISLLLLFYGVISKVGW